jgi:hypothetical protein
MKEGEEGQMHHRKIVAKEIEKKETEIRENEEGRRRINASLSLSFPFFLPIWKERKTVGPGVLSPRFHATKQGSIRTIFKVNKIKYLIYFTRSEMKLR